MSITRDEVMSRPNPFTVEPTSTTEMRHDKMPRPSGELAVNIADRALYLLQVMDQIREKIPVASKISGFQTVAEIIPEIKHRYSPKQQADIIKGGKLVSEKAEQDYRHAWGVEAFAKTGKIDPVGLDFFANQSRGQFIKTYLSATDADIEEFRGQLEAQAVTFGKAAQDKRDVGNPLGLPTNDQ